MDSKPGEFGPKQAVRWVLFYVSLAIAFGIFLAIEFGSAIAGQFFAGYITEYSLSVDNLFVFIVIMSSFAVPRVYQHRVLLVGVVIALVLRGILIVVGRPSSNGSRSPSTCSAPSSSSRRSSCCGARMTTPTTSPGTTSSSARSNGSFPRPASTTGPN